MDIFSLPVQDFIGWGEVAGRLRVSFHGAEGPPPWIGVDMAFRCANADAIGEMTPWTPVEGSVADWDSDCPGSLDDSGTLFLAVEALGGGEGSSAFQCASYEVSAADAPALEPAY